MGPYHQHPMPFPPHHSSMVSPQSFSSAHSRWNRGQYVDPRTVAGSAEADNSIPPWCKPQPPSQASLHKSSQSYAGYIPTSGFAPPSFSGSSLATATSATNVSRYEPIGVRHNTLSPGACQAWFCTRCDCPMICRIRLSPCFHLVCTTCFSEMCRKNEKVCPSCLAECALGEAVHQEDAVNVCSGSCIGAVPNSKGRAFLNALSLKVHELFFHPEEQATQSLPDQSEEPTVGSVPASTVDGAVVNSYTDDTYYDGFPAVNNVSLFHAAEVMHQSNTLAPPVHTPVSQLGSVLGHQGRLSAATEASAVGTNGFVSATGPLTQISGSAGSLPAAPNPGEGFGTSQSFSLAPGLPRSNTGTTAGLIGSNGFPEGSGTSGSNSFSGGLRAAGNALTSNCSYVGPSGPQSSPYAEDSVLGNPSRNGGIPSGLGMGTSTRGNQCSVANSATVGATGAVDPAAFAGRQTIASDPRVGSPSELNVGCYNYGNGPNLAMSSTFQHPQPPAEHRQQTPSSVSMQYHHPASFGPQSGGAYSGVMVQRVSPPAPAFGNQPRYLYGTPSASAPTGTNLSAVLGPSNQQDDLDDLM